MLGVLRFLKSEAVTSELALNRRQLFARAGVAAVAGLSLATLSQSNKAIGGLYADLVVDKSTGYAIYGYDPVAYFDEGSPRAGEEGVELRWHGAIWRFQHEGNRAAFKVNPEVYAPQFGGHDPLQLSRGYVVEGSPLIWMVLLDKLYFFHSLINLRIWQTNPLRHEELAQHNWERLRVTGAGIPDPAVSRLFGE